MLVLLEGYRFQQNYQHQQSSASTITLSVSAIALELDTAKPSVPIYMHRQKYIHETHVDKTRSCDAGWHWGIVSSPLDILAISIANATLNHECICYI